MHARIRRFNTVLPGTGNRPAGQQGSDECWDLQSSTGLVQYWQLHTAWQGFPISGCVMAVPDIEIAMAEPSTWQWYECCVTVPGQDMVDEDWTSLVNVQYM